MTPQDDDDAYRSIHLKQSSELIINSVYSFIGELFLPERTGGGEANGDRTRSKQKNGPKRGATTFQTRSIAVAVPSMFEAFVASW